MAKYRPIFTKTWSDPDFQDYSKDERLIFFYLCTNPWTSESGIYPITCLTIAQATKVDVKIVTKILEENRIKNVIYDPENKGVFVSNFLRYNGRGRKDLVIKSIYNDYKHSKTRLWDEFGRLYPEIFHALLNIDKEQQRPSIPNPISNSMANPKSNRNPNRNTN